MTGAAHSRRRRSPDKAPAGLRRLHRVGPRLAPGEALFGLQQPMQHDQLAHQLVQGLVAPSAPLLPAVGWRLRWRAAVPAAGGPATSPSGPGRWAGPAGRLALDPVLASSLGQPEPAAGTGGPPDAAVQVEGDRLVLEADAAAAEGDDDGRGMIRAGQGCLLGPAPGASVSPAGALMLLVGAGPATPSRSALDPTPDPSGRLVRRHPLRNLPAQAQRGRLAGASRPPRAAGIAGPGQGQAGSRALSGGAAGGPLTRLGGAR